MKELVDDVGFQEETGQVGPNIELVTQDYVLDSDSEANEGNLPEDDIVDHSVICPPISRPPGPCQPRVGPCAPCPPVSRPH